MSNRMVPFNPDGSAVSEGPEHVSDSMAKVIALALSESCMDPAEPMPVLHCTDDVEVSRALGDPLDDIWWQGRQWAVTSFGIEARDGKYAIDACRLRAIRAGTSLPDWPLHMGEKNWVDLPDFCTAFMVGLVLHDERPSSFTRDEIQSAVTKATRARLWA